MNQKEKHVRENKPYETPDQIAESMPAEGKNHKRKDTVRTNRLWMWLGIIVLIFILLYWLFAVGTFEDMLGVFNG
ncbi:MAG: hypothetical protein K2J15_07255 [Muribaculaceae bacterium]|nr:hypothetical protein [Muribaculaceae bacterium]